MLISVFSAVFPRRRPFSIAPEHHVPILAIALPAISAKPLG